jgi:hypothetical protein
MLAERQIMKQAVPYPARQVVALFNASDDTVEMVQRMLDASGFNGLIGCHFSDLKKGRIDFARRPTLKSTRKRNERLRRSWGTLSVRATWF